MAHDNVFDLYYDNYINMSNITDDMNDKQLGFTNSLWGNFGLQGYVDMGMYKERNLEKKYFEEFVKGRIDQESYIFLFYVDKYYYFGD